MDAQALVAEVMIIDLRNDGALTYSVLTYTYSVRDTGPTSPHVCGEADALHTENEFANCTGASPPAGVLADDGFKTKSICHHWILDMLPDEDRPRPHRSPLLPRK